LKLDYAAYVGNSDPAYITSSISRTLASANDTTMFKLVGGRIGIRTGNLKAGISGTYDREKVEENIGSIVLSARDVPRYRFGGDVSFRTGDFSFEGEFILCRFSMSDPAKAVLNGLVLMTMNPLTGKSPFGVNQDEAYYYANLMYDVSVKLYIYGGFGFLQDDAATHFKDGVIMPGFRPVDNVVVKAQYMYVEGLNKDILYIKVSNYNLAVNVLF
jgi:hypothetical protein